MTAGERRSVPAVGGTRTVPAPDPIASDYLLLGLRLDQHIPGLVDGYFGPASIKAQVDMEQRRSPSSLRDDALALRERLALEVAEPGRRAWFDAQLVALEAQSAALALEPLPYEAHVARCMGFAPQRRPEAEFAAARAPRSTVCSRATDRSTIDWRRGMPASRSRPSACPRSSTGSWRAFARERRGTSACPTARTCGCAS